MHLIDSRSDWKNIALAAVVNAAMGILYLWSLFLLPLENSGGYSRADLSLVPAIALVGFTVGMGIHDRLVRALGRSGVAVACFLLAGGGHLTFAFFPSYSMLLAGYGIAFGLGSGIGYGLALSLSASVTGTRRGLAIGVAVAAFALSGILLPQAMGSLVAAAAPQKVFSGIGAAMLVIGAVVFVLLRRERTAGQGTIAAVVSPVSWLSGRLLALGFIFFAICFVGLMTVSHNTGIAAANGLSPRTIELMPTALMLGYLVGSLFGGRLVEAVKGRAALIASCLLAAAGLWAIDSQSAAQALSGAAAIGLTFGASASLMPTLIGEQYGADQIGPIYGRLIIAYGVAGLVAPWATGLLFDTTHGYQVPLIAGIALCAIAILLEIALGKAPDRSAV